MMESTSVLVNKLCLRIALGNDQSEDLGVGDIVLGMMYKQISQVFNILFDWRTFSRGGTFITADNRVKGNIQTAHTSDDHMLWAARLSVKDDSYQRRRWVYNMSIVQISDEEISFYYAKCYQDHLAGSLKSPRERPKTKDMLPEILFNSPQITCMMGRYAYPRAPIVLDDYSLNDVMDIIMDPDRPIPIMLITCPDVVSPETIFDMTKGNLIVACCDDTRLVMDLNAGLPKNLYTQWDSIHILMPLSDSRAYHPTYTYSDIRSMGIDPRRPVCRGYQPLDHHPHAHLPYLREVNMICTCGNDRFIGHQIIRADVIVGADGSFLENVTDRLEDSIYDAEKPYGPFTCTACGREYDELR